MLSAVLDCRVGLRRGKNYQGQYQKLESRLRSLDNKRRYTVRRQRIARWHKQVLNTKWEPSKYPFPGEADWLERIRCQRDTILEFENAALELENAASQYRVHDILRQMEEYEMKFLFRSIEGDDCCSDELRIICTFLV